MRDRQFESRDELPWDSRPVYKLLEISGEMLPKSIYLVNGTRSIYWGGRVWYPMLFDIRVPAELEPPETPIRVFLNTRLAFLGADILRGMRQRYTCRLRLVMLELTEAIADHTGSELWLS
jgi:hypothetical protein